DLEFVYDDSDIYENEISEQYTYTEEPEFQLNKESFEKLLKSKDYENWSSLSNENQRALIMHIIQTLDVSDKSERFEAVRWVLYLVQGVFGECSNIEEQKTKCRTNCFLLYKLGIFNIVQELLMMEINQILLHYQATLSPLKYPPPPIIGVGKKSNIPSLPDSLELRSLITILYTMVETLRRDQHSDSDEHVKLRKDFFTELEQGLNDKEPLIITLFNMVCKFCSHTSFILPMKKVLLLLWKLLLTILGGFKNLHKKMETRRQDMGLPLLQENPIEIVRQMSASAPPTSAADLLDIPQGGKRKGRKVGVMWMDDYTMVDSYILYELEIDTNNDSTNPQEKSDEPLVKLRREQQTPDLSGLPRVKVISGLPWTPKARKNDVESLLEPRQKFIGFTLPGDLTTVAGLPEPTQDSLKILQKHAYTPMSELQVARESEISKCPLTIGKTEFNQIIETSVQFVTNTPPPPHQVISTEIPERLYQAMLPHIPQYMIALLKILLAAAPTAKAKTDSINILSDVLPQGMPSTAVASLKLGIDVNRHREIFVKSISGLILLLLKHFKLNHVYQFEYMSQHLVFANCIPLVLKFFNQNIVAYVTTKNMIPSLEFPACVIGELMFCFFLSIRCINWQEIIPFSLTEITAESFDGMDANNIPCWRNLFSSINLLRILNKLVKWKHSRTMLLVVFKSAPILKRALKVRQAMFQLYVLKLLKVQTKYLGRAWRKSNMKTMSAIYQKVRHRLHDDWAFGNDVDAQPWDFQQEECALRAHVERFNARRYGKIGSGGSGGGSLNPSTNDDYTPVENNLQNLLKEEVELPIEFRKSYDTWLEREVYFSNTDWDQLLS
uniref:Far11/STRP C-terminal domain-containing protein n=1 Tax=Ciona savignyi TaxID=51511 RepID=H2YJ96_CIOSA